MYVCMIWIGLVAKKRVDNVQDMQVPRSLKRRKRINEEAVCSREMTITKYFRFSSLDKENLDFFSVCGMLASQSCQWCGCCWNDVHERDRRKRLANDDDGSTRLLKVLAVEVAMTCKRL